MFLELEVSSENHSISTDKTKLDIDMIYDFLRASYWAMDLPKRAVKDAIRHSLCFGLYEKDRQVGFARVISDFATFAYLADVFLLEAYRGKGLGKWLLSTVLDHPDLLRMPRWLLLTKDAHAFYEKQAFVSVAAPEHMMERLDPDAYNE